MFSYAESYYLFKHILGSRTRSEIVSVVLIVLTALSTSYLHNSAVP